MKKLLITFVIYLIAASSFAIEAEDYFSSVYSYENTSGNVGYLLTISDDGDWSFINTWDGLAYQGDMISYWPNANATFPWLILMDSQSGAAVLTLNVTENGNLMMPTSYKAILKPVPFGIQ